MRRNLVLSILFIGGVIVFALAILPLSASAITRDDQESSETTDTDKVQLLEEKAREKREKAQQKLDEQKRKVCDKRSANINAIMDRSVSRVEKHKQVFDTISERVQSLYEKKGKNVANYESLLMDVHNAKAQVEADISALKAYDDFSCDSDDPKGQAESFRTNLQAARDNLKTYRQSIKDLIVGVRSANTQEEQ